MFKNGVWRTKRCPPSSNSRCFTIQKDFMKHCNAQIITRRTIRGIPNPCYNGLSFDLKGFAPIYHKFWFCANDLTHYLGRTRKKYCVNRPLVPSTWLVQIDTNLTQFEVIALEEAIFILCEACKCVLQTFFACENTTTPNQLIDSNAWANTCNNKAIWCATTLKFSTQQTNRWEVGWTLEVVLPTTKIPSLGYG